MHVLCLPHVTLWERGSNIINWRWTQQGALESKLEWSISWIIQTIELVKNQDAMVGHGILFMVTIGWIIVHQWHSNSLWGYGQIF
jgi:hypothetical protein